MVHMVMPWAKVPLMGILAAKRSRGWRLLKAEMEWGRTVPRPRRRRRWVHAMQLQGCDRAHMQEAVARRSGPSLKVLLAACHRQTPWIALKLTTMQQEWGDGVGWGGTEKPVSRMRGGPGMAMVRPRHQPWVLRIKVDVVPVTRIVVRVLAALHAPSVVKCARSALETAHA